MYIQEIKIKNYRIFDDFSMEFHKGLNVIIGANNSGKTGLLYAIKLLKNPNDISIHDFNKNNLLKYKEKYLENAPEVEIEYKIFHEISEENTEDESIIKLISFLGMEETKNMRNEKGATGMYYISACIKMIYALDSKFLNDYKTAVKSVTNFDEYMIKLEPLFEHYSWKYTNGVSDIKAEQKDATEIFEIKFIGAERTSADIYKDVKKEIDSFEKSPINIEAIHGLKQNVSDEMKKLVNTPLENLSSIFKNETIGLSKGNIEISQNIKPNITISDGYITEIKDTF